MIIVIYIFCIPRTYLFIWWSRRKKNKNFSKIRLCSEIISALEDIIKQRWKMQSVSTPREYSDSNLQLKSWIKYYSLGSPVGTEVRYIINIFYLIYSWTILFNSKAKLWEILRKLIHSTHQKATHQLSKLRKVLTIKSRWIMHLERKGDISNIYQDNNMNVCTVQLQSGCNKREFKNSF